MMKYELENFMKPFLGEIEIIIDLGEDGDETPTGVADAEYYIDAHGHRHVKLIPASILTRRAD